jgi:hypothetical protein
MKILLALALVLAGFAVARQQLGSKGIAGPNGGPALKTIRRR